jgi:hypothetical protein
VYVLTASCDHTQFGAIPIHVHADGDVPWLPYAGSANSSVSLALGLVATPSTLGDVLTTVAMVSEAEIDDRRRAIRRIRESHITFRGLMQRIEDFVRDPVNLELECTPQLSPTPPISLQSSFRSSTGVANSTSMWRELLLDDGGGVSFLGPFHLRIRRWL